MNRSFIVVLIAAVSCLLCSCALVTDAFHQSRLHSEYEREKNTYTHRFLEGKTIEYTKLGFGIADSPTSLVKTQRKWDLGFRERWWEPSRFYDSVDEENGQYSLLIFACGKIPKWAVEKDYCAVSLGALNGYLRRPIMFVHTADHPPRDYTIGGRGWKIKTAETRDRHDLLRNDKLWNLCRYKLTLANGQQMDFTLCHLKRDNWLYAFKLLTPEPRRNDDFELMLEWMGSFYFLTNSSPPNVAQ